MKKCKTCGIENSDAMHFCVECGTPLATSPIVVNIQQERENEPPPTYIGGQGNSGGQGNFSPNFANVPAQKPKSYAKILLALGGLFALLLLLLAAAGAIVYYNLQSKKNPVVVTDNSPTPAPSRSIEKKSPTPLPVVSPKTKTDDEMPPPPKSDSDASADFDKVWVDYNVTDKNRMGMRIHVKFTVRNMKNVDSNVAVYFQMEDDTNLLSNNREFRSNDGRLAVYRALKPLFDVTDYNDLDLFIPYTEFNLSRGKYKLKMDVDVIYKNGDLVQHLTFYDFEYEKP